jgi:hypothetical protein
MWAVDKDRERLKRAGSEAVVAYFKVLRSCGGID